jgi:hypothetical protein
VSLVRSMMFIDGENLTFRYQAMVKEGRKPKETVFHIPDVCVWDKHFTHMGGIIRTDVVRASYYTSMCGDDDALGEARKRISELGGRPSGDLYGGFQLVPHVYKKPAKSQKSRLVDINIVIDVMRQAYSDSIEKVYILSGDGDFVHLVEEIGRRGKQVCLAAFSSGLDSRLAYSVDSFVSLDDYYFEDTK